MEQSKLLTSLKNALGEYQYIIDGNSIVISLNGKKVLISVLDEGTYMVAGFFLVLIEKTEDISAVNTLNTRQMNYTHCYYSENKVYLIRRQYASIYADSISSQISSLVKEMHYAETIFLARKRENPVY